MPDPETLHLLNAARMVLDRAANGDDVEGEAAFVAQRIVEVTGHDVTDESPHLLVAAERILEYAQAHLMTLHECSICPGNQCYEEWVVLRDDLRQMVSRWRMGTGITSTGEADRG